jgi:molybdenum cofactor cytidylyltransferase
VIFARLPVVECTNAILAHSTRLPSERTRVLKKGRVLSSEDVAALKAAGHDRVMVVQLENDDVTEDAAAARAATAIAGPHVKLTAPFTGRVNLIAPEPGLVTIDRVQIDSLNAVHEAITVATLPPMTSVVAGQLLATVKIIPFAAPGSALAKWERLAGATAQPAIGHAPFRPRIAGLVQTRLPGLKETILDKTARTLGQRMTALGGILLPDRRCAHEPDTIAAELASLRQAGADLLMISGASAITDRRDVVPDGIVRASGKIRHFGMPVDPGNLLLLAAIDDIPVLGLPGCARSPALNGIDWALQRLFAGLELSGSDLMAMGVGGLLKDTGERPQSRSRGAESGAHAHRVAAIVLAAGSSRRMGSSNKLLAVTDGAPMVVHAVQAASRAGCDPVIAVTGHQAEDIQATLAATDARLAYNADHASGLASSLRAGLLAVPDTADGVVVLLADMPRVRASHVTRLLAAFDPADGRAICVPTWDGAWGNPVLFARTYFDEIIALDGDTGARQVLRRHEQDVAEVAMDDDAVRLDVDTPDALAALRSA